MQFLFFIFISIGGWLSLITGHVSSGNLSAPQQPTLQLSPQLPADSCYQLLNSRNLTYALRDQGVIKLCQEVGMCGGYSCKLFFVCDGDHYRVAAIREVKSFHAIYSNAIAENIDLLEIQVNPHCGLAKEDTLVIPFRANLCIVN